MNILLEFVHEHILAIDLSMFIIIWLVQLILYPAFLHIAEDKFRIWHKIYCKRISYLVLPLMLAQLFESLAACFFIGSHLEWMKLGCVLSVWLFTFLISAPCHQKLTEFGKVEAEISTLISTNWYRTWIWSAILFISYIQY
jgi:hypothetical protein